MKTQTIDQLLNRLTSFRTLADLKAAQTERGYVPTMYRRNGEWNRLIRACQQHGIRVWTGSN